MVLHWDGKLLPEITNGEKVDRLPIIVSQRDTEQLLSVPKLSNGCGDQIAAVVSEQIQKWQLTEKIQAVCFDTTAAI